MPTALLIRGNAHVASEAKQKRRNRSNGSTVVVAIVNGQARAGDSTRLHDDPKGCSTK
ncbi:hypothetical protein VSR34_36810 [Paraburkholderia sp. JHI2823]|uniref:hypothetical protein n=1 Tax=Paraburkholderia TaxID=1822464 RepID=UPI003176146E